MSDTPMDLKTARKTLVDEFDPAIAGKHYKDEPYSSEISNAIKALFNYLPAQDMTLENAKNPDAILSLLRIEENKARLPALPPGQILLVANCLNIMKEEYIHSQPLLSAPEAPPPKVVKLGEAIKALAFVIDEITNLGKLTITKDMERTLNGLKEMRAIGKGRYSI